MLELLNFCKANEMELTFGFTLDQEKIVINITNKKVRIRVVGPLEWVYLPNFGEHVVVQFRREFASIGLKDRSVK